MRVEARETSIAVGAMIPKRGLRVMAGFLNGIKAAVRAPGIEVIEHHGDTPGDAQLRLRNLRKKYYFKSDRKTLIPWHRG
jgi:hypothetical protein